MTALTAAIFAASTVQAIGTVIGLIAVGGFLVYALFNFRAGREEVGAELELAANLKPYMDDDELETKKLDRTLTIGLAGLVLVGVGLPAYWLAEPGRQDDTIGTYERIFASRGSNEYEEACASCHGPEGVGGVASYTILSPEAEFVAQVQWKAPALNTAMLRYSEEEVTFILNYGRAFSPMPAWGVPGGGAMTEQDISNLIAYLQEIKLSTTESKVAVEEELRRQLGLDLLEPIDYDDLAVGEALFNLGQDSGFAAGAYSCGRCHTRGWSIDDNPENIAPPSADLSEYIGYPDGSGGYGPQLRGGVIPRQFTSVEDLADFLHDGAERGQTYGRNGLSSGGMMPGFGENPNTEQGDDGMLTDEMILAIARYVESLED